MKSLHVVFLLHLLLLCSCYNAPHQTIQIKYAEDRDTNDVTLMRPYGIGDNFVMLTDSLLLAEERPMHWSEGVSTQSDSLVLYKNNRIVVAAVTVIPEDSIDSVWIKVARDQFTMGWVHEQDFLDSTAPDDPISQFINLFSSRHTLWFLLFVAALCVTLLVHLLRHKHFKMVHFDDIPSAYPTLLTSTLTISSLIYAYIQHYQTAAWVTFYFHPTLNPLAQPLPLCFFLLSVWLLVLLSIAVLDDVFTMLRPPAALLYLFSLLGVCIIIYLTVALISAHFLLGLFFGTAYLAYAWYRYLRCSRALYRCGQCGTKMRHLGICPRCGTMNE